MQKEKKLVKPKNRDKFYEELVKSVEADFEMRRKMRLKLERQWELNMNFLVGNQYCDINSRGEIVSKNGEFFWQEREVYNHIAPIVETRLAKFADISPVIGVRPKTDDDSDVKGANLSAKLLTSVFDKNDLMSVVHSVAVWSETCGTGFYKVVWDNCGGASVGSVNGEEVFEGEAEIIPVSPFEIFPDNLYAENLEGTKSLIHAKAVPVSEIKAKYGVALIGEKVGVFNLTGAGKCDSFGDVKTTIDDAAIVIEKYELPTEEFPSGRLITVAGGKLLYYGELPYKNGKNGTRGYPFIKQECIKIAGNFFGLSVIERLIPVQRAYNAVKNRKQEFLNRLSMGVMTVEDGSIDVDDLAEEGLSPGKILVYRQGGKAPELMGGFTMPDEFSQEEENLINEFVRISGVSDITSSTSKSLVSSGTALEILIEQDNARMVVHAEIIRNCVVELARQVIRLYAQFTAGLRAVMLTDKYDKLRTYYVDRAALCSDDVFLENENELLYSRRQKRDALMNVYTSGLLGDENGEIRPAIKEKLLALFGFKDLDYRKGISRLQEEKAQSENDIIRKSGLSIEEIDDDGIHIDEHERYILSEYGELTPDEKQRLFAHIRAHKERLNKIKGENV
ncbi:MAG: hypothetical protein IJQ07_04375 [Clostridia bacterium]|nr:hypothetical protein [Clostridia bacterium]